MDYLSSHGVMARVLDRCTTQKAERRWREVYGNAFRGRPRLRQGTKAETEYSLLTCPEYRIIPFTSNVNGTAVHVIRSHCFGIECFGRLLPLGKFHSIEFFISPMDYEWTMVHTHEDHALGGPFFIKLEWLPRTDGRTAANAPSSNANSLSELPELAVQRLAQH